VPERQLTYAQSGIRLSLGHLLAVRRGTATITLIVQNERDAPVHFAVLQHRRIGNAAQAVLSDASGTACIAGNNPAAIEQISRPARGKNLSMGPGQQSGPIAGIRRSW
jgi:hypothetical protein